MLQPGDHIKVKHGLYEHHGIYIGNGIVVQSWSVRPNKQAGTIQFGTLADFAGAHARVEVVPYGVAYPPQIVVRRALYCLGAGGYHLFNNNCEHFARWCKTGLHVSEQVERVKGIGLGTAGGGSAVAAGGAVAGVSGPGIMSGLAATGAMLGVGAAGGIAVLGVVPGAVGVMATRRVFRDGPSLPTNEREARRAGRAASVAGAALGAAVAITAISAAGTVAGLSGPGIASGLAAMGGSMMGGLAVAAALPVASAAFLAYGAYRLRRR